MERKLVKQGRDALTVTLPVKWIQQKGLKAGNSVNLEIKDSSIIVSAGALSKHSEISLNVTGFERSMIWHTILGAYISGYDSISITHDNPSIIQYHSRFLIGMILEKHTATKSILRSMIAVPESDISSILRRIGHMFGQLALSVEDLSKGKLTIEDVKDQERLLDTNIYYCFRFINKYNTQQDSYRHFLLCSTIESAGDVLVQIAKRIKKDSKLANTIAVNCAEYSKCLYSNDFEKAYSVLRTFRNKLEQKTFVEGLTFELAEILYNYVGYLVKKY